MLEEVQQPPAHEGQQEAQDRRRWISLLLAALFIFLLLFGCGQLAMLVDPSRPTMEVRSGLFADYSFEPPVVFGALSPRLIAEAAGDSGLPFTGANPGSGCFLPGLGCLATQTPSPTPTASNTPTATASPTATATPTDTATPTNTPWPTFTPTATDTPTNTPTPTPLVWPLKLVNPGEVDPLGDTVTVSIIVVNYGNTTGASLTEIVDRMPPEMTWIPGSCSVMPGPSAPCTLVGNTLTFTFSPPRNIPQNQFVRVTFQADVAGMAAGGVISNEAEARGGNFATSTYVRRIFAYTPTPTSTPITIPVANDDPGSPPASYVTNEDTPFNLAAPGLLANDTDAAWDTLSAALSGAPTHGVAVVSPDGSFTYTPALNYFGSDSFTYQACDAGGSCDTATVYLSINPVPDWPVALDDNYATNEDVTLNIPAPGVLGNDSDVDGDPLTIRFPLLTSPAHGGLTLNGDGSFAYVPDPDYFGPDQFTYRTCDQPVAGLCDTATVFLQVNSVNDPPEAVDDVANTDEDVAVVVDVLANDADPVEGDSLNVVGVTQGADGTVSFTASDVTYTPNLNFNGIDAFTYTVSDGNGGFDTADVDVTINPVNDPPIAVDDPWPASPPIIIGQGGFALINVWANDYENPVEGDTLYVSAIVSPPASGGSSTATVDDNTTPGDVTDDHAVLYTPDPAFHHPSLPDTFVYELNDGNGGTAQATVSVIVNDAPAGSADAYSVDEDTTLDVPGTLPLPTLLDNDSDPNGDPIQAVILVNPLHAQSFTLNPDGSFSYTPVLNYFGADSFTYRLWDGGLYSGGVVVSFTINPINDPPVAADDSIRTNMNTPLNIPVLANDTDIELDPLSIGSLDLATLSTLGGVADNGTYVTYTPPAATTGLDEFLYQATDGMGDSNWARVAVTISGPPVAIDDAYITTEDTALVVSAALGVLDNDSDLDGDPLTAGWISGPSHGLLSLNPDGSFTYTPVLNYNGGDSFTYQACDPGGAPPQPPLCDPAVVDITVNPANDAPTANDDSYTIDEDITTDFDVIVNDTDIDGTIDPTSVVIIDVPLHGSATPNADGSVTYNPDWNYNGSDSFTYTVDDNDGATSNIALVDITIDAVNDPPVANNDSYSTGMRAYQELSRLVVGPGAGVLANDSEPEGQPLTVTNMTTPAHQTTWATYPWEWYPDGAFNYAPLYNYHGLDTFTYTVCDDTLPVPLCSTGTVRIAVNDPPVAAPDSYSTDEDTLLSVSAPGVLANDTDPNASPPADVPLDVISASIVSGPSDGALTLNPDGSFTYNPDPDFFGFDSFTYEACDLGVPPIQTPRCDSAVVDINVNAVNDPPVASADSGSTNSGGSVVIDLLANDSDPDSGLDPATLVLNTTLTTGSVIDNGDGTVSVSYASSPGYYGLDTFTYSVQDDHLPPATSNTATVTITVNAYPVAVNDSAVTDEDVLVLIDLIANDSDADGSLDSNTILITSGASNGSLWDTGGGVYRYTPNANYYGSDSFRYTIDDDRGATSNEAIVSITINPIADNPVANDDSYNVDEDQPLAVAAPGVLSNDGDADNLPPANPWTGLAVTLVPASGPLHASTFTLNGDGSFNYTPQLNYEGADSFQYEACDGTPLCAVGTVTIDVNPVNDNPTALPDSTSTNEDNAVIIDVLFNDTDPDAGDVLFVSAVSPATIGVVTNNGSNVTYTPNLNAFGPDSFTYTVSDGNGGSDTASVTVTVNPVNDAPVANPDGSSRGQFGGPLAINVLSNDFDVDGDPVTIDACDPVSTGGGSITCSGASLSYDPGPFSDPLSQDTFGYTITDGNGAYDSALVSVLVNDAPQAVDDDYSTDEDTQLVVAPSGVLSNDNEPNADPLFLSPGGGVSHGTLSLSPDGSFTYDPASNYFGLDQFTYQVCDAPSGGLCDTATVDLTILPVNDLPLALNDSVTRDQVTAVGGITIGVSGNDSDIEGPLDLASILIATPPAHGTAIPNPANDGSILYTLTDARFASDSFTYTIDDLDGGTSNTATVTITISPPALRVDKTSNPSNAAVGDTVTFFITIWNEGPGTAFGVQLTDQLGSCFTWLSGQNPSGLLGDFAQGDAIVLLARARRIADTGCASTNTASVTSSNGATDIVTISVGLPVAMGGSAPVAAAMLPSPTPNGAGSPSAPSATITLLIPLLMVVIPLLANALHRWRFSRPGGA